MSTTIDQRVVEMQFDNSKFESNVKTSMSTIEKLKESLNFSGSAKGLENINSAVQDVNMSGLGSAVETVKAKFSALEVIGVTALANITNSAVNAGKQLLSSLTVDNIADGWEKFADKTQSVGTLIAQGYDLDVVNEQLERLNWYTDETSYNFTDMVSNIAKFTASGQDLETSVTAMEGIANWAALSGQNATTASRAMYQLSQAMSVGYMRYEDYKSIQNASMDTEEFRQKCLDAAVALGTLQDNADGTYTSIVDGASSSTFSLSQFTTGLTEGAWLTSDVMMDVFNEYSGAVDQIYEYAEEKGITASEAIEELGDSVDEFGLKAFKAAQEARSWADVVSSVKDALSTAFMNTFELIFGNYEEATALWTSLANSLYDIFVEPVNSLNELLEGALGEHNPFSGLVETIENVTGATETMTAVTKDYGSIVDEVLNGDYGNGQSRWDALTEAGYDWAYVQNLVNERLGDATRHATDFEEAQGELSEVQQITIEDLTKMSEAELKNLGFTEDEIQAFRELAEQSEKTGISITDLMEDTDQLSGRALLLEGFANIGQALLDVFSAIGKAWRDVFPATTSEQLYDIIAAFHKFTTYLEMHEETLEKVERTFRGLFSILDIIKTVVGSVLSAAFSVLNGVLGECNINILDITANIGDVIYNFSQWLKENNRLANAIKAGADILVNFIKKIKELIEAFLELPVVSSSIDGVIERLSELKDIGVNVIEGLKNGLEEGTLTIPKIMVSIGNAILNTLKTVLGIHSPSTETFAIGWNVILGLVNSFKEGIKLIASWVSKIGSTLLEGFGNIDWSKVFAGGMSVALLFVVKKLIDVYKNFVTLESGLGKTLSGIGDTLSGFGKVLSTSAKSISKTIKSVSKVIKAYSFNVKTDGIKNLAVALGILVAAVVALSLVDQGKLLYAEVIVITLAGILVVLSAAVTKMGESAVTINKTGITINSLVPNLMKIASSLLMMAAVMKIVGSLDADQFEQGVVGLAGAAGMLIGIVWAFEEIGKIGTGGMNKAGKTMLALSAALGIMAVVIKMADGLKASALLKGLAVIGEFSAFAAAMVAIANLSSEKKWAKVGSTILSLSASLALMTVTLRLAEGLSGGAFGKGVALIAEFSVFAAAMVAIANLSSEKKWAKVGSTILSLSASLALMTAALKLIDGINATALVKGVALIAEFSAFATVMIGLANLSSEKKWAKVGTTMLALSAAIGIMAGIAVALSLISISGLAKGVTAVGLLGTVMTLMIKATKGASDCKGSITAMAAAIGIMAVAVAALSFIQPSKLVAPVAAMGTLMALFALIAKSASNIKSSAVTLGIMVGVVAVLASVLAVLSLLPIESSLTATASLSALMISFSASCKIINGIDGIALKSLGTIGTMSAIMVGLGFVLKYLGELPVASTLATAVSLSVMLLALSAACQIINGMEAISVKAAATVGYLGVIMSLLAIPIKLVGELPVASALTTAVSLSAMLLALSAACQIINNMSGLTANGYATVGSLALIMLGLATIVYNLAGVPAASSLATAVSLSVMLLAMSGACVILGYVGEAASAAIEGIGVLAVIVLALGVVLVGIGALVDYFPRLETFLEKGSVLFESIGTTIGTFLGNIIGGFSAGAMSGLPDIGTYFSEFVDNLDSVLSLDESDLKAVKTFAELILTLAEADFIDSLTFWKGSGTSLSDFGDELKLFGPKMKAYADSVDGIDSEAVEASANAALALGELESNLPKSGSTVAEWFLGEKDLGNFGSQLEDFGDGLKKYSIKIRNIDVDAIAASVDAASALVELENCLPKSGSTVAEWFLGEKDLGNFGSQLEDFGKGLKKYSDAITEEDGINVDAITASVDAAAALVELEDNLPKSGSTVAEWFLGEKDLGNFGSQLEAFGTSLVGYSETVAGIDSDALTSSTEQFSKLVDLTNDIGTVDYTKVSGFSESLRILGNSGVTGFVSAFECSEEQVTTAVNTMVGYVDTAVTAYQNQNDDIAGMGALATAMITELENSSESFETVGTSLISSLLQGIGSKVQSVQASCKAVMNLAISAIKEKYSDILDAGDYVAKGLIDGLVNGIIARISEVEGAIDTLSNDTIEELREVLGVHSPSTITELIGEFLDSGLIQGIKNKASDVTGTAKSLASSVIDVFQTVSTDGLSGITDSLSSGLDDYVSTLMDGVFDVSEIEDYFVDYTGSTISDTEDLQQTSIEDEKGYWAALLKIKREGEEAEKYSAMSVAEFQEDILSQTSEIWQNYVDEWSNATDTLMNKSSIFSEVSEQEAVSAETLTQNLEDQIEQVRQYGEVMASLNQRISDVDLKEVINDMGVDSLAELQALNSMTDEQLTNYVNLYNEKYALCQTAAATQLSDLQSETEQQLSELYGGVDVKLQDFAQAFDGTFASINQYVATAVETGIQIAAGVGQGVSEGTAEATQAATDMIDQTEQAAKDAAQIHSPSKLFADEVGSYIGQGVGEGISDTKAIIAIHNGVTTIINNALTVFRDSVSSFTSVGEYLMDGLAEGINSKESKVSSVAAAVASAAYEAACAALEINSPSRKFMEIGRYSDEGFIVGLNAYSGKVEDAASSVGEDALGALSNTISSISDVISEDLDTQPVIAPVLDLTNVEDGASVLNTMFSRNQAMSVSAGFAGLYSGFQNGSDSGNDDVVEAIGMLRSDVESLKNVMGNLKVVMDTGTLVGTLTAPINSALGRQATYEGRGI